MTAARILFGIVLWIVVIATAMPAHADGGGDRREVTARELFAAGKYNDALAIYIKLYAERPHPTYLRNIGRCYQNLAEPDRAISSFREYLRQAENLAPQQRALVEGYIAEMEALKRQQAAEHAAADRSATATVKPEPAAKPEPTSDENERRETIVREGRALPPATGIATAPSAASAATPVTHGPAPFIVAAASAAALGVGGFFGWRAISKRHDSDAQCIGGCSMEGVDLNNQAKTAARTSDVTVGLGLVGAGVATYLFLSSPVGSSSDTIASPAAAASRVRLFPAVSPTSAGAMVEGAW